MLFICSAMYVITLDTATLKDGSWDNVPYASDQYSNNVTIDENGDKRQRIARSAGMGQTYQRTIAILKST
ncbi:MAG: hypothetical protein ACLRTR_07820 [Clostridia bacterium]